MSRPQNQVTRDYVDATRLGVHIRTPLENVTHFKAEDKYVTVFTKANGQFTLNVRLWDIASTICHMATSTHRSYLVMNHALKGAKMFKPTGGEHHLIEVNGHVASSAPWWADGSVWSRDPRGPSRGCPGAPSLETSQCVM